MRHAQLVLLALAACQTGSIEPPRPNVLFIAVDDLRPELGCYGVDHAVTPHMDALARSGVRFDRAYCQSGVCNPSRASAMTGKQPESIGVLDLGTDLRKVRPDILTLPQHFRAFGYRTASVGKIYHNIFPDEPSWDDRHYVDGYPFDPDAVYVGEQGRAIQAQKLADLKARGRAERRLDQFGHYYLKAQATEAPDCDDDAYYDGAQTTWAVDKLSGLKKSGQPFFLAVGYYRPHLPFNAPRRYWDLYDRSSIPLANPNAVTAGAPSMALNNMRELRGYTDFNGASPAPTQLPEADQRRLLHGYLASVSYVDTQVGRLLAALDDQGLSDNTIVVLWSDHGWKLGEHASWGKMTNYEIDTRVPLLVRAPGCASGGSAAGLVELLDMFPTLCELCDVPTPGDLEGRSFADQLRDPTAPGKDVVHTIYRRQGIWIKEGDPESIGRAVRTDTHRYVEWRRRDDETLLGRELYDLRVDPDELENLADRPEHATLVQRLASRI